MEYTGRFAPSPTGPLHFGSLLAALASYLQARSQRGRWLLRMEDIDPPREQRGAGSAIIRALESYGFEWHGPVLFQSRNIQKHREVVARLIKAGQAYRCGCSRADLSAAPQGPLGAIYPGTCRDGSSSRYASVRVRTDNSPIGFDDLLQGPQSQRLEAESGDFVIQRRDRLIAYHLAVVIDDFDAGISQIVRGVDLLDSTPRQIYLQTLLAYPTPEYAHIPVAVNPSGQKLSKTTGARAIPLDAVRPTLIAALRALRQTPPVELADANLESIWGWATEHWSLAALVGQRSVSSRDNPMAGLENRLS
ncbi:MAG: tRNA glutamyl-Q(34) synthetase GluQRS [Woeseia sp.]